MKMKTRVDASGQSLRWAAGRIYQINNAGRFSCDGRNTSTLLSSALLISFYLSHPLLHLLLQSSPTDWSLHSPEWHFVKSETDDTHIQNWRAHTLHKDIYEIHEHTVPVGYIWLTAHLQKKSPVMSCPSFIFCKGLFIAPPLWHKVNMADR